MKRFYGWKKQKTDTRDFSLALDAVTHLPPSADLRAHCPPVYDQGELGSCTANAIAGAFEFDLLRQGLPNFVPSRLFIYYGERVIEGTVHEDSGAEIRDGMKVINQHGVCTEVEWPYDTAKFAHRPSAKCFTDALANRSVLYRAVRFSGIRAALAAGLPVVGGFTVFESFESEAVAETGIVPMPTEGEQEVGGHAIMIVGYDDASQRFIVRNSWGASWGQAGYFTIPYAAFEKYGNDWWTLNTVK